MNVLSDRCRILLLQLIIGCTLLCNITVFAAHRMVMPYTFGHVGGRLGIDSNLQGWIWEKFLSESVHVPVFAGGGVLIDPNKLGDWFISIEGMGHLRFDVSQTIQEKGGFILGKVAFPQTEGVENFLGAGIGGLWLSNSTPENSETPVNNKGNRSTFSLAVMVQGGRQWHLNNGVYGTIRGIYLYPMGENRKPSLSLTFGLQWSLD